MEKILLDKLDAILVQMKHESKNEILCLDDAAFILGFSKSYLYKLTSNRKIPHYKPIGKSIFFKRSELMIWIESSKVLTVKESTLAYKKSARMK